MKNRRVTFRKIGHGGKPEELAAIFDYYRTVGLKIGTQDGEILVDGPLSVIIHFANSLGLNRVSVIVKAIEDSDCQLQPVPFREQNAHTARSTNFKSNEQ